MIEQKNQSSYDAISAQWDAHRRKKTVDPCVQTFADMLPQGAEVLDLGCGSGYPIAEYLSENGLSVLGLDISSKMIEIAAARGLKNANFIQCDFMNWNEDRLFDGVIAFDSLWHISEENQAQIYEKVSRHLKKDGLFLFTHGKSRSSVQGEMFGQKFYYTALDQQTVRQLLLDQGFEILTWTEDYRNEISGSRDLLVIARKQ